MQRRKKNRRLINSSAAGLPNEVTSMFSSMNMGDAKGNAVDSNLIKALFELGTQSGEMNQVMKSGAQKATDQAIRLNTQIKEIYFRILNSIEFTGSAAELAIKEAIRCKLHAALELRKLIAVTQLEMQQTLPFEEQLKFSALVMEPNGFKHPLVVRSQQLLSFIPAEALIASLFFNNINEGLAAFKSTKLDIELELTTLFPSLKNPARESVIQLVKTTRETLVQYAENYLQLEQSIIDIANQQDLNEQIAQWQTELVTVLLDRAEQDSECQQDFNLRVKCALDKRFIQKALADPTFSIGYDFTSYANETMQIISSDKSLFESSKKNLLSQIGDVWQDLSNHDKAMEQKKMVGSALAALSSHARKNSKPKAIKPPEKTVTDIFTQACEQGNLAKVKELIKDKKLEICVDSLVKAAEKGHDKVVAFLLDNRFQQVINEVSPSTQMTPLMAACKKNHLLVVKVLVRQRKIVCKIQQSALSLATATEIITLLTAKLKEQEDHAAAKKFDSVVSRDPLESDHSAAKAKELLARQESEEKARVAQEKEVKDYFERVLLDKHTDIFAIFIEIHKLLGRFRVKPEAETLQFNQMKEQFNALKGEEKECVDLKNRKRHIKVISKMADVKQSLEKMHKALQESLAALESKADEKQSISTPQKSTTPAANPSGVSLERSTVAHAARLFAEDKQAEFTFAEIKAYHTFKTEKLSRLKTFCGDIKLDAEHKVEEAVVQRMQMEAKLLEIMQLMEMRAQVSTTLKDGLDAELANQVRTALVHRQKIIPEALKPDEFKNLCQQIHDLARVFIADDFSKLPGNDFFATLCLHGAELQIQLNNKEREKVTDAMRMTYTFTCACKRLLFTRTQQKLGSRLPLQMVDSALAMNNIQADIYGLYDPESVSKTAAIAARHLTLVRR